MPLSFFGFGQKYRLGQDPPSQGPFTVKVHVSASHLRSNCSGSSNPPSDVSCGYGLYLDVLIDGTRFELSGSSVIEKHSWALIIPGDYVAQVVTDARTAGGAAISRGYKLRLPDGTLWPCTVTGVVV